MIDSTLGRCKTEFLSGDAKFHFNGTDDVNFDVQEFWAWSASDLVENTARGVLAEFLVAKALDISMTKPRRGWGSYDLKTDDELKIEVKSAAYVQSWNQSKLSSIQFDIKKRQGWDPDTDIEAPVAQREADVYVFALLAHKDKPSINPLDLSQWEFWALATVELDRRERSQHSIALNSLIGLAGPSVGFNDLPDAFLRAVVQQKELELVPVAEK